MISLISINGLYKQLFYKFNTTCKNSTGYRQVSVFIWIILSDNRHIHGSAAVERYYWNCFFYTHMKDVWSSDEQLSIAEKNNKNINKQKKERMNKPDSFFQLFQELL